LAAGGGAAVEGGEDGRTSLSAGLRPPMQVQALTESMTATRITDRVIRLVRLVIWSSMMFI
jgi:hypothetical protein